MKFNKKGIGEMAERSKAAVLKTVEVQTSLGSNPNLSAKKIRTLAIRVRIIFLFSLFLPLHNQYTLVL